MGVRLGNGNWGVKANKLLAYNDASGMFFNKEFDFTRATTATRVNKSGLIESVAANVPRIDFTDDTKGHLLLEPERTNVCKNSENTSTWTYVEFGSGSAGTITTGKTDMFGGTNAVQVDFPADAENVAIRLGQTSTSISSGTVTQSVYIKLVESGSKILRFRGSGGTNVTVNSTDFVRYTRTATRSDGEAFNVKLRPSQGTSNGGFSIILCHPQEEAGSFATSYIPCTGSDVTRTAERCNGSGALQDFNSTEGVLYCEIAALADDTIQRAISISNSTIQNTAEIFYNSGSNQVSFRIRAGNSNVTVQNRTVSDRTQFVKVALKYKNGDIEGFINGVKEVDRTDSLNFSASLSELAFDRGGDQSHFKGKIREVRVYSKLLTDAELIALTT